MTISSPLPRLLFEVKKMNKTKFYDERLSLLSFPTKLAKAPGGIVEVYIIPDEKKKRRGIN